MKINTLIKTSLLGLSLISAQQGAYAMSPIVSTFNNPSSGISSSGNENEPLGAISWVGPAPSRAMVLTIAFTKGGLSLLNVSNIGSFKTLTPTSYQLNIPAGTAPSTINMWVKQLKVLGESGNLSYSYSRANLSYADAPPYLVLWQGVGQMGFPP